MPRLWTNEQRLRAAELARLHHPWKSSTGPRTAAGKIISSRNSYKHGRYSHERTVLTWYVRLAVSRLKRLQTAMNYVDYNYRNELITKYRLPTPQNQKPMALHPHRFGLPVWRPPKPRQKSEEQVIYELLTAQSDDS